MNKVRAFHVILFVILVCLLKLAFFPDQDGGLIPNAHAQGGMVKLENPLRIVTASEDGATAYVWDFQGKTSVRKYYIKKGKLNLKVYNLD